MSSRRTALEIVLRGRNALAGAFLSRTLGRSKGELKTSRDTAQPQTPARVAHTHRFNGFFRLGRQRFGAFVKYCDVAVKTKSHPKGDVYLGCWRARDHAKCVDNNDSQMNARERSPRAD